jgi:hypothetical protein
MEHCFLLNITTLMITLAPSASCSKRTARNRNTNQKNSFCKHGLNNTKYISIYGSTALCWALAAFSVSLSFTQNVRLPERGISPSQGRYLHTGQHKQNKRTQISMLQVGFELTIPVFKWEKTVHALDHATTVIGILRM